MKKIISIILAAVMALSLAACSGGKSLDVANANEILTTVWGTYEEADKFPIAGGDYENSVMDAPGAFNVSDTENLDYMLGLPADSAALIDDAASMMHMMNQNTFTCGAFHLADSADQQALADALKANIMAREWMCGFPDTLIIVALGNDYIVSAFGGADVIETFKTKLTAAYEAAEIIYEESLAV